MEKNPTDETIKEILKEDQLENGGKKKKKSCLVRFLVLIIFLVIAFFGFILIQQYLLNLEAQVVVDSIQTATAQANELNEQITSPIEDPQPDDKVETDVEQPAETPTPDPAIVRTATVAAQLTSVAEFQLTATDIP